MFHEMVRTYRLLRGLTQEELSAAAGLAVRTIRDVETARVSRPRPSTVRLLADAFGLRATERDRFHEAALLRGAGAAGVRAPV